jgi:hypothetical protein
MVAIGVVSEMSDASAAEDSGQKPRLLSFDELVHDQAAVDARASALWRALTDLDGKAAERAELRSAGVAESTIDSLYPVEFEALVPGIIATIGEKLLAASERNESPAAGRYGLPLLVEPERDHWRRVDGYGERLISDLPTFAAQQKYILDWDDYYVSDAYSRLMGYLDSITYKEEDRLQPAMASNLWSAFWLMTHSELLDFPKRVRNYFCGVMEWALPALWEREVGS